MRMHGTGGESVCPVGVAVEHGVIRVPLRLALPLGLRILPRVTAATPLTAMAGGRVAPRVIDDAGPPK